MTVNQLTVCASVQIFRADPIKLKPEAFGTGCVVTYRDYTLLLSVSHVTNKDDGLASYLETNIPVQGVQMNLQPVGDFIWYEVFKTREGMDAAELEELLGKKGEGLDVTFSKVDSNIDLRQRAMDFGYFNVDAGEKVVLDLNLGVAEPEHDQTYGFYGTVRQQHEGKSIKLDPVYMNDLKFLKTIKHFHWFLAPKVINDADDLRGCSGAPILDSDGRIVALACKVKQGTRIVLGFSIQECIKLIDMSIDLNEL